MWKVTYSKNIDSSEPIDSFEEGRAEDGKITVLHPFSDDFHLGPKPSKGTVVSVVWEHDDESHTNIVKIR
ncbi:hypothetical protein J7J00_01415 [Bacillus sp. ISL-4]|uniref:hypothetical protein n=1 Tax=Bacillus sp. ISL-4 TaxID=2819125 RepID=UPI001BE538B0|nr:hypothetical protein [Bacillus sp. ISL-4]MBT2664167.1 hypothetical protein [Bacillus sp. ISL-4]MBT2674083.1 hypothetical protein [Streptomyces sp. ISL-14]